jgi:hypothetical protein
VGSTAASNGRVGTGGRNEILFLGVLGGIGGSGDLVEAPGPQCDLGPQPGVEIRSPAISLGTWKQSGWELSGRCFCDSRTNLGPRPPLDRRGSPCNSSCIKNQPRTQILKPSRDEQQIQTDCLQVPRKSFPSRWCTRDLGTSRYGPLCEQSIGNASYYGKGADTETL